MAEFIQLLRESVIVQGILTVMICGAWLAIIMQGRATPDSLNYGVGLVLGFYFGSKVQSVIGRAPALPPTIAPGSGGVISPTPEGGTRG